MLNAASRLLMPRAIAGATDPNFSNVSLLMHMEGANNGNTFTDQRGAVSTVFGGAVTSTAQSKYGSASLSLPNAGATATDYLSLASAGANLGTGNFTIEWWMRPNTIDTTFASQSNATIFDLDVAASSDTAWWAVHQVNAGLVFGSNGSNVITSASALVAATWNHVAIVRNAGQINAYIGGVGTTAVSNSAQIGSTRKLFIGVQSGLSRFFRGNLDEVRFTPGVARYTGNFTPPVAAFPNS